MRSIFLFLFIFTITRERLYNNDFKYFIFHYFDYIHVIFYIKYIILFFNYVSIYKCFVFEAASINASTIIEKNIDKVDTLVIIINNIIINIYTLA